MLAPYQWGKVAILCGLGGLMTIALEDDNGVKGKSELTRT